MKAKRLFYSCAFAWLSLMAMLLPVAADGAEPSVIATSEATYTDNISVPSLSQKGEHFQALTRFLSIGEAERTIADQLAAAKSAWALGLVDRAREIWNELLNMRELDQKEKQRLYLSRAVMELQEDNSEMARSYAEKGVQDTGPSELRAQMYLVIAESLKEQGIYSRADEYYQKAKLEAGDATQPEVSLLLGECQMKLGQMSEARYSLTEIPYSSKFSPEALRRLAQIDFQQGDADGVVTWISEGLNAYQTEFDQPRIRYMQVVSLLETKQFAEARKQLKQFALKHSENNSWYILAQAAVEEAMAESKEIQEPDAWQGIQPAKDGASAPE